MMKNGMAFQTGVFHHRHHFKAIDQPIDPYLISGGPSSGLIPKIRRDNPSIKG